MEVITIESRAFKQLIEKLEALSEYVYSMERPVENVDEEWVSSQEICRFLKISERTLQRFRTNGKITYTSMGGKYYYQIAEIKSCFGQTSSRVPTSVCRNYLIIKSHVSHNAEIKEIPSKQSLYNCSDHRDCYCRDCVFHYK